MNKYQRQFQDLKIMHFRDWNVLRAVDFEIVIFQTVSLREDNIILSEAMTFRADALSMALFRFCDFLFGYFACVSHRSRAKTF